MAIVQYTLLSVMFFSFFLQILFPVIVMYSIWYKDTKKPTFRPLDSDKNTDVLIIGGGIAGILCAYELTSRGIDCILLEAKEICQGVTENTTAKITVQHSLIFHKLIKMFGKEKAALYLKANTDALARYASLCSSIDCDFEYKDNYVYVLDKPKKLDDEIEAMRTLGMKTFKVSDSPLPFAFQGAVCLKDQAQFNPLKFLYAIAKDLPIHEHTKVLEYKDGVVTTDHGTVTAKKIICATHFPIFNKHGLYPIKMYQSRSYVIALQNATDVKGMYIDGENDGLSFRNYGNLLLLGGGSHRTGADGGGWDYLRKVKEEYFPESTEVAHWATQDCMTLDGVPYIGQYSKNTPDLYVTTGFNKWGMTTAMAGAMILGDMIEGKENKSAEVFEPSRSIFRPQLIKNAAEAVAGILNPGGKRCPHLGCKLIWNEAEHSWDCPCHGSRFTEQGQLIDNPATDDIKKEN